MAADRSDDRLEPARSRRAEGWPEGDLSEARQAAAARWQAELDAARRILAEQLESVRLDAEPAAVEAVDARPEAQPVEARAEPVEAQHLEAQHLEAQHLEFEPPEGELASPAAEPPDAELLAAEPFEAESLKGEPEVAGDTFPQSPAGAPGAPAPHLELVPDVDEEPVDLDTPVVTSRLDARPEAEARGSAEPWFSMSVERPSPVASAAAPPASTPLHDRISRYSANHDSEYDIRYLMGGRPKELPKADDPVERRPSGERRHHWR